MKKVGDLMKDLGFRDEASEGAKRAFIENLVRAATGVSWPKSASARHPATANPLIEQGGEQLSFDLSDSQAKLKSG